MTRHSMLTRTRRLLFVVSLFIILSSVHLISSIESIVLSSLTCSSTGMSPFLCLNPQTLFLQASRGSRSFLFTGTSSKNDRDLTGYQRLVEWKKRLSKTCRSPAPSYHPEQINLLSSYRFLLDFKSCKLFPHDVDHIKMLYLCLSSFRISRNPPTFHVSPCRCHIFQDSHVRHRGR